MIDNSTKWLVRGNTIAIAIIALLMLFGGHTSGKPQGSTITTNGLTTNAPSSGVSNFNAVEADYGFYDTASATSNLLGSLTVAGGFYNTGTTTTSNGVTTTYYSSSLSQASTTVCSFVSPAATSTLNFVSLAVTTGTTTALVWDIGKSTLPSATTTILVNGSLASNLLGTLVASTTMTGGAQFNGTSIFGPSTYLNFKYGGAQGSTNVLVGACKAIFIVN